MAPIAKERPDVLVLGAGLAGSCVALALAQHGHRITIVDRAPAPMSGASRVNEGKVHLGFVYALDHTLATQRRMLCGALSFSPLLDRFLGPQPWERLRSEPFRYAVMPESLVAPDDLEEAYARTVELIPEMSDAVRDSIGTEPVYVGRALSARVERGRGGDDGPHCGGGQVDTVFSTQEVAVDPDGLATAVCAALRRHPLVDVRTDVEVVGATRTAGGFAVDVVDRDGRSAKWPAPIVANCLWEDRLRVDATIDVAPPTDVWFYRVKHRVRVRLRPGASLLAVTMVQGPYGDVVSWQDSTANLSWYPVCRTQAHEVRAPVRAPFTFGPPPPGIAEETIRAMQSMFPALVDATVIDVRGGVIVAPGNSDIDQRRSRLHVRATPAAHEHDGWWTIDTGKLTLAPFLAHGAATRIDAALRGR